tara:strand:+ start:1033 stop:1833 length:801 start_codon:yes stop_codon:yes gene_type:complete
MPDRNTKVVHKGLCVRMQNPVYTKDPPEVNAPDTQAECENLARGTWIEEGTPEAQDSKGKMNLITRYESLKNLSSAEAMAMGNDVAIGLGERSFKGVIYAPQIDIEAHKENEGYDKFSDMHWRAVWSRHGGAFDIVVDYPAPVNDCRQANSNKPVDMDFWLDFEQICCNERGPLMYHECQERCWHHYLGPHLMDMELALGMTGDSIIHVNIHEAAARSISDIEEKNGGRDGTCRNQAGDIQDLGINNTQEVCEAMSTPDDKHVWVD